MAASVILQQLIWLPVLVFAVLGGGVYLWAVLDGLAARLLGLPRAQSAWLSPLSRGAWLLLQQANTTEAPDLWGWRLAPALYLALAALGLALVPWSRDWLATDLATSLVLWGSVEALATVVIFLHGWSANSHFALMGAYRYVALGLSYILISMFVLIGAALPAESLALTQIVDSQEGVWNVVRQPLGLPLFLLVGLALTFRGPFNLADTRDMAGGTGVEVSGPPRLLWELARSAMLVAFSGIAATVFLGGWLGPWLPGPLWVVLKMLAVLAVLAGLGRWFAVIAPSRCLSLMWLVLLPLSFVDLVWAGVVALL